MHLSPRELDHLRLAQAGQLAQRRLARGCRLNHPEAVALISSQMMEMIRDGKSVAELMVLGQQLIGRRQVLPNVASMISTVQVEATFEDGTKLLSIHSPISARDGDLSLALHGSFLPVPDLAVFGELEEEEEPPGAMFYAEDGGIELNAGRNLIEIGVTNSGDRPIQASIRATRSHRVRAHSLAAPRRAARAAPSLSCSTHSTAFSRGLPSALPAYAGRWDRITISSRPTLRSSSIVPPHMASGSTCRPAPVFGSSPASP
jgi:urease gamma subunit